MIALPARLGGLGIGVPPMDAPCNFQMASTCTRPLVEHIISNVPNSACEAFAEQSAKLGDARKARNHAIQAHADAIRDRLPPKAKRALETAQERGASSWLTALPLVAHGFSLTKGEFRDAICLRYGWELARLPSTCTCGSPFNVDHGLSCTRGGYVYSRHNEVRDLIGGLLKETCSNVEIEPTLQPLDGELFVNRRTTISDSTRLDIKAGGFWGHSRHEVAYFDAPSYRCTPM